MHVHLASRVAAGVIVLTAMLACDSKTSPTVEPVVVAVELSGTLTIAPGATTQLTLTAVKNDGSRTDISATAQWSAFGSNAVTSLGQGRFLGRANGDSIITGRDGRLSATREIIVVPDGTYRINGRVFDAADAGAAVAGALVRAQNGGVAGPFAQADGAGNFRLYGVSGEADLVVTREGYVETTQRVHVDKHTVINLAVPLAGSRLALSGTYTATFDFAQCTDNFQQDFRRRIYSTTVTQTNSRVAVRFTSPRFATLNGVAGNVMDGNADAISVVLATPVGADFGFYGGPDLPVIEILPDDTRLVFWVKATLSPTASGFSGPLTGEVAHYGPFYPLDTVRGRCAAGTLTMDRQ